MEEEKIIISLSGEQIPTEEAARVKQPNDLKKIGASKGLDPQRLIEIFFL